MNETDPKTVSIVGSCNSRELFNYEILKNQFKIKTYAFQTNIWDMFSDPLNVGIEKINQIPVENFLRRMLDYDLNKKLINELLADKSDYIIIDIYSIVKDPIRVTMHGKSVYVNNLEAEKINNYINNNKALKMSSSFVEFECIQQDIVLAGLEKFATFVNENYIKDNVIIVYPQFLTKYLNTKLEVVDFEKKKVQDIERLQERVDKFTDFLCKKIPGCKIFKQKGEIDYATYILGEAEDVLPSFSHHHKFDEALFALQLSDLINGKNTCIDKMSIALNEYQKLLAKAYKAAGIVRKLKVEKLTSINNYIYNDLDLNKNIVLIAAKDEASAKLHKFIAKNLLCLKFDISFRQSYIGIVNKAGHFYHEESSDQKLSYRYKVKKNVIEIESAGYLCGNKASIKINGVDFCKNSRGLNFVIINNKTFKVVNAFSCDFWADDNVLISL